MRVRAGFIAVAALVVLTAGAPAAHACNEPGLGGLPPTVGPGSPNPGPVPFSIANTDPGATYTLQVAGRTVASGTDLDGGGVAGTFTMPDLGSDQAVAVEAFVSHEGSSWPSSKAIQFRAAVPAQGGPGPTATTPGKQSKGAQPDEQFGRAGRQNTEGSGGASAHGQSAVPSHQPTPASGPTAAVSQAGAPTADAARAGSEADASFRGREGLAAMARGDAPGAAVRTESAAGGAQVPAVVIAALVLMLIAGLGGLGVRLVRGRAGGPPQRRDAAEAVALPAAAEIEAELQEMIAEHRARQLVGERVGDP